MRNILTFDDDTVRSKLYSAKARYRYRVIADACDGGVYIYCIGVYTAYM